VEFGQEFFSQDIGEVGEIGSSYESEPEPGLYMVNGSGEKTFGVKMTNFITCL